MKTPNIILMMCDDLGYGDVGFNGNKIINTPNLDRLANNGIRFTRFYAGGPVCSPTRGTCLTGRHYFRYGVTHANRGHLPSQEITLARMLKSYGYTTGHFGKWHLGTLDPNYSGKPNRNPEQQLRSTVGTGLRFVLCYGVCSSHLGSHSRYSEGMGSVRTALGHHHITKMVNWLRKTLKDVIPEY